MKPVTHEELAFALIKSREDNEMGPTTILMLSCFMIAAIAHEGVQLKEGEKNVLVIEYESFVTEMLQSMKSLVVVKNDFGQSFVATKKLGSNPDYKEFLTLKGRFDPRLNQTHPRIF